MKLESRPRELHPEGLAIAIVAARFNEPIVEQLIEGAVTTWQRLGGLPESIELHHVPGAFELPLACEALAATGSYSAIVALGCVIRGDTAHFDYVAGEAARGIMNAGLATGVPVIFGVLTVENVAQAEERADPTRMNKAARRSRRPSRWLRCFAVSMPGRRSDDRQTRSALGRAQRGAQTRDAGALSMAGQ